MKALDDIQTLLTAMQDRGAEMRTFEGLLSEISTALADILSVMEKPADERAESKQMSELVRAVSNLSLKSPDVRVNVQPAPVTVVPSDWKSLSIEIGAPGFDGSKKLTITKVR